MKMLRVYIILFMISVSVPSFTTEGEKEGWMNDIERAKTLAEKDNKPILLYFSGSDWCKPCIILRREVMDSEIFKSYAKGRLVLVEVDFPRLRKHQLSKAQTKHNEALAKIYNNEGAFPKVVIIDAKGNTLGENNYQSGGAREFIKSVDDIINK